MAAVGVGGGSACRSSSRAVGWDLRAGLGFASDFPPRAAPEDITLHGVWALGLCAP